ncbi:MAG: BofC C-terminal domain-containing protein, partial [Clostridia bacterium]|nr:BofC C-terminal domain-containing protein [Clostridia bacterium]
VVLLEHDGIIGIFDGERKYLLGTINVSVKTLPEYDRKKLLEGIEVKDSDKFISLFEDYSS